jgi:hypothetical protein
MLFSYVHKLLLRRTSDAPWGRQLVEFLPFSNGNLMAASVMNNGVAVYSGALAQLGGNPRDPTEEILAAVAPISPYHRKEEEAKPLLSNQLTTPSGGPSGGGGGGGFLPMGSRAKVKSSPAPTTSESVDLSVDLRISPQIRKQSDIISKGSFAKQLDEVGSFEKLASNQAPNHHHHHHDHLKNKDSDADDDRNALDDEGDEDQGYQDDFETYVEKADVHLEKLQEEVDAQNNAATLDLPPRRQFLEGNNGDEDDVVVVPLNKTLDQGTLELRATRRNRTGVGWSKEMIAPPKVENNNEELNSDVDVEQLVVESYDDDAKLAEQISRLTADLKKENSSSGGGGGGKDFKKGEEDKGFSEDELASMLPGQPKFVIRIHIF